MNDMKTHRYFITYLLVTAVLCGALVMVIEVLGSRVIGPFFGVSLFVWTSLITVTLIALAAGYGIGGYFSDRRPHPRYLYLIILAAGFLVVAIPYLKGPVLKICLAFGLRTGSFASTLALFGLPLFLLGCVSPYLVKIMARELHTIGKVVGGLYSLSTLGSIAGTILTGFVLIAFLAVDQIFHITGLILIGLGVVYLVWFERKWWAIALILLPLVLWPADRPVSKTMRNGTHATLIHKKDSHYGNLKVVDYSYQDKHVRELIIDGFVQGGVDMRSGQSIYAYSYLMEILPTLLHPGGKDALIIGLGAGIIPPAYQARGIETQIVDIDPHVVDLATQYFGFPLKDNTHISDARYFLTSTDRQFDYIILDVFNGDITPGYLISQEAMQLISRRLTAQGVLAFNLVGSLREHTYITASVVKTLESVFDQVEIYPTFDAAAPESDGTGNLSIMAYQGAPRSIALQDARNYKIHPWAVEEVFATLTRRFTFPAQTPAIILTDNYNPIDFYDNWMRAKIRQRILETTDWDILTS